MPSPSLKQAKIRYSNKAQGRLQCLQCGAEWTERFYKPGRQQRRRRGWWKCPEGCNADIASLVDYYFPPPGEMEGGG